MLKFKVTGKRAGLANHSCKESRWELVGWLEFNSTFNAIQVYRTFKVELYYKYKKCNEY